MGRPALPGLVASSLLASGLVSCGQEAPGPSRCDAPRDAIVAMSDYSSSGISALTLAGARPDARFGVDLGKDPQLSLSRGRLFFVARDKDLLFELDPACGAPIAKVSVHDETARANQNPQDVAVAPDGSLWVPRFSDGTLLIISPTGARRTLSLAAHDADGNPQPNAIRIVDGPGGSRAFVALERLDDRDGLRSNQPSQLLEIDVDTLAEVAVHPLVGKNPFNRIQESGGALWLAAPGSFDASGELLAGIERFDLASRTSALRVREADLGGSVVEIAIREGCGVAIVANARPNVNATSLVTFDPATGKVLAPAASPVFGPTEGYDLQGLAWVGDVLLLGDRRPGPRGGYPVRAFKMRAGCAFDPLPEATQELPQKPVSIRPRH